jgi:hypothetical protein
MTLLYDLLEKYKSKVTEIPMGFAGHFEVRGTFHPPFPIKKPAGLDPAGEIGRAAG